MRRINQRPICAIVDVELIAPAPFLAYNKAAIFRRELPARFSPQFRRIADRQTFECPVNGVEIIFQRWWLHARIDRWEASANIDNIDCYRCIHNRCANPFHRLSIGVGRHYLTADIETDTRSKGPTSEHQSIMRTHHALLCYK